MSQYSVVNPYTGETVKEYETATDDQVREAVERADAAFDEWSRRPLQERAEILGKLGDLFIERKEELGKVINTEMGKPLDQAIGEAEFSGEIIKYYADNAEEFLADEVLPNRAGVNARIRKSAQGVILGIMPWNYPYYQVARFAMPNMVLGNTIVLKHASQCPWSAEVIAELCKEAGVPEGVYENVRATSTQIAEIVIPHDAVRGVSLTGSEAAGAAVAEVAGRNLKKCVLELGGSDPFIVLNVADLDPVVEAAIEGRFENSGQACNASKRYIVLDEHYDEFVEKVSAAIAELGVGEQDDADAPVGALSSQSAADGLRKQLQSALDEGAQLLVGEPETEGDTRVQPKLLAGITEDMDAYREELFGPIGTVYRAKDVEEAIKIANDTPYGLGSKIFCDDIEHAREVADRIDAGMVVINGAMGEDYDMPFGGVKNSGYGRELGPHGMEEFMNKKFIAEP